MNFLTLNRNNKTVKKLNLNRFFKFKKLNQTKVLVVGHRGARGLASENTIASFEKAVELGVDIIELDVVISKDKQVVVSHEAWMNHEICTQENKRKISSEEAKKLNLYQMNYNEIKHFDCGSLKHPLFEDQENEEAYKPLLKDALLMIEFMSKNHEHEISYTIEIKSHPSTDGKYHPAPKDFVQLVMQTIQDFPAEKINLRSFDLRILKEIKKSFPAYSTCLISENGNLKKELKELGYLPEVYSPNYNTLSKSMIKKCRKKQIQIIPWTVNEFEELKEILLMNIDGIITDYPNRAIRLRDRFMKLRN